MYGMKKNERVLRIWKRTMQTTILLTIIVAVAGFCLWLEPNYEYENAVGGHLDNAQTTSTPEQLMSEIENALEGVEELGLEDDDYGAWFHWFKTEQVRVGYQTERLDNITIRLEELIEWRDTNNGTDQEMKDVYNNKFVNIRDYVHEDPSAAGVGSADSIIEDAWFAKEHSFVYLAPAILGILICVGMIWAVLFMPLDIKYDII